MTDTRQYALPGGGYINRINRLDFAVPGVGYVSADPPLALQGKATATAGTAPAIAAHSATVALTGKATAGSAGKAAISAKAPLSAKAQSASAAKGAISAAAAISGSAAAASTAKGVVTPVSLVALTGTASASSSGSGVVTEATEPVVILVGGGSGSVTIPRIGHEPTELPPDLVHGFAVGRLAPLTGSARGGAFLARTVKAAAHARLAGIGAAGTAAVGVSGACAGRAAAIAATARGTHVVGTAKGALPLLRAKAADDGVATVKACLSPFFAVASAKSGTCGRAVSSVPPFAARAIGQRRESDDEILAILLASI